MTKQIYYILSFILLISTNSFTQSNNLWLRTTFSVKDSLDITYEFEFQNRLQTIATESIPKHPFFNSGRIWIHYSINEKLKISLSPVAFFDHIKYKNKDELYLKSHITEYRNSLAAEYQFIQQKHFIYMLEQPLNLDFYPTKKMNLDGEIVWVWISKYLIKLR